LENIRSLDFRAAKKTLSAQVDDDQVLAGESLLYCCEQAGAVLVKPIQPPLQTHQ